MDLLASLMAGITDNWAPIAATMALCWKVRGWLLGIVDEVKAATSVGREALGQSKANNDLIASFAARAVIDSERVTNVEHRVTQIEDDMRRWA